MEGESSIWAKPFSRRIGVGVIFLTLLLAFYYFVQHTKHATPPLPPPKPKIPTMTFQLMQYNIFGRPYDVSYDGQKERLERIPPAITAIPHDIDAVTFAEADIASERVNMLQVFKKHGYNYSTSILHDTDPFTSLINGGVLVVSKWPIVREAQHIYRHSCHYSDCLAAKGVKYARINKTINHKSKIFNVFATHMQAWSTAAGRADRVRQIQQLHAFVKALQLPESEPVIYAGDFNTDNISFPGEVHHLINTLEANIPHNLDTQPYTSDPHTNLLVGRDGAASSDKCIDLYRRSWGPHANKTYHPSQLSRQLCTSEHMEKKLAVYHPPETMCYCPCCPSEWLDYILFAKAPYQQPVEVPTIESIVMKADPFVVSWTAPSSSMFMELTDLSDHYPVVAKFEFDVSGETIDVDGCTNDSDCHFYEFHCYCSGPNCRYHGTIVNGRKYPPDHPVNKNCLYLLTHGECTCGPNLIHVFDLFFMLTSISGYAYCFFDQRNPNLLMTGETASWTFFLSFPSCACLSFSSFSWTSFSRSHRKNSPHCRWKNWS